MKSKREVCLDCVLQPLAIIKVSSSVNLVAPSNFPKTAAAVGVRVHVSGLGDVGAVSALPPPE